LDHGAEIVRKGWQRKETAEATMVFGTDNPKVWEHRSLLVGELSRVAPSWYRLGFLVGSWWVWCITVWGVSVLV